jgi:hypothetical protein
MHRTPITRLPAEARRATFSLFLVVPLTGKQRYSDASPNQPQKQGLSPLHLQALNLFGG